MQILEFHYFKHFPYTVVLWSGLTPVGYFWEPEQRIRLVLCWNHFRGNMIILLAGKYRALIIPVDSTLQTLLAAEWKVAILAGDLSGAFPG